MINNRTPPVVEDSICVEYLGGTPLKEIARMHNVSVATVHNILKRKNIPLRGNTINNKGRHARSYSKETEDIICKRYVSEDISMKALGNIYGLKNNTVHYLLSQAGIKGRDPEEYTRIHTFDETYFVDIMTEGPAYWLGFILGDGNVCKTTGKHNFSIQLSTKDYDHLVKFKKGIQSEHPIHFRMNKRKGKEHPSSTIRICSKKLCAALEIYGIAERKTYTGTVPENLPENILRHFYRGLIDADGCLTYRKGCKQWGIDLVGNEQTLLAFDSWLRQYIPELKYKKLYPKYDKIFTLTYNGNIQAFKIASLLYENSNFNCRLDRKHDKYLELKRNFITSISLFSGVTQQEKYALLKSRYALV